MKPKLVSLLMCLYPKAWRNEYGAELAGMLRTRPLTVKVCNDVVLSALWQRARAMQVSTWVGLGLMGVTIAAIAWNILDPPPYAVGAGIRRSDVPSLPDWIELLQRPMGSELYVLVLAGIGFWTGVRGGQSPGRAAIRVSAIASLPIVVLALLMMSGAIEFVELRPGQTPMPFEERGIVYTFYKGFQRIPGPTSIVLLLSPLLTLPGAWLWGVIFGGLGRKYSNWRRRPVSA
jgi:hypothetical protein